MMTAWSLKLSVCFLVLLPALLWTAPGFTYDNDGPARQIAGGPHRKINDLAMNAYLKNVFADSKLTKFLKNYTVDQVKLVGTGVTAPGSEPMPLLDMTEGDRKGTLKWWIVEGGYTADEPEIFNSFRHFYDPVQKDGVAYLTDHLTELDYVYKAAIFSASFNPLNLGKTVNPQIDACDWAIHGAKHNGMRENAYSWDKGLGYMRQAFSATGYEKDRLFVKAWRSLGETMHLMADMSCVPHVRNDSHPGRAIGDYIKIGNKDPNKGLLKNDPYELLATEQLVAAAAGNGIDPELKKALDACTTPEELFHQVALYTNANFFSADTISGVFNGTTYHNANGRPDYDAPKLELCAFDKTNGYFSRTINNKPIRVAHLSWLAPEGWGANEKTRIPISSLCIQDQASILVPIAVYANAKLADWFIPRLSVNLTAVDVKAKTLTGKVIHTPYRAYNSAMNYSFGKSAVYSLLVDGFTQDPKRYSIAINNGVITGKLPGVMLETAKKVTLLVEIGGIMVRSDDFALSQTPKKPEKPVVESSLLKKLHKCTIGGGSVYAYMTYSGGLTARGDNIGVPKNASSVVSNNQLKIKWSGTSFSLTLNEEGKDPYNGRPRKVKLELTGSVSPDGKMLTNVVGREYYEETNLTSLEVGFTATNIPYEPQTEYADLVTYKLTGPTVPSHASGLVWVMRELGENNEVKHEYALQKPEWNKPDQTMQILFVFGP